MAAAAVLRTIEGLAVPQSACGAGKVCRSATNSTSFGLAMIHGGRVRRRGTGVRPQA